MSLERVTISVMMKRLVIIGTIVLVIAGGRWACDTTIRDQRLIDHLVRGATSWFPDSTRPEISRVYASQTRTGRMGGRQEHLYIELARPKEFEEFIRDATSKLGDAGANQPIYWRWRIQRDVQINGSWLSSEPPRWWPRPGRADVVLTVRNGAVLFAPTGSDRMFMWYFVP